MFALYKKSRLKNMFALYKRKNLKVLYCNAKGGAVQNILAKKKDALQIIVRSREHFLNRKTVLKSFGNFQSIW